MKTGRSIALRFGFCLALLWSAHPLNRSLWAGEPSLVLQPAVQVDADGVFLGQVARPADSLPKILLSPAPGFGRSIVLTRDQIQAAVRKTAPDFSLTNWSGPDRVRVSRRSRPFAQDELGTMLTAELQQKSVKDRGELELRFARPWPAVDVPDEPLKIEILDMPTTGVSPMFIVRFELRTAHETVGSWQASLQARIWKEIWVAQGPLRRGNLLRDADLARERRDMMTLHEAVADISLDDTSLELAEGVPAGFPLMARMLKLRAIVHRGQSADAVVRDGALEVTMRVEVLEDGVPGQIIRARNPQSRREIRGKVLNEQTLLVVL